jgi:DNA gyrase subunit A
MKTTEKTGLVVGVVMVSDEDQVILVTDRGKVIRIRMADVRVIGRNTQGVRLIDCEPSERVSSVARLAEREEDRETDAGAGNADEGGTPDVQDAPAAVPVEDAGDSTGADADDDADA